MPRRRTSQVRAAVARDDMLVVAASLALRAPISYANSLDASLRQTDNGPEQISLNGGVTNPCFRHASYKPAAIDTRCFSIRNHRIVR